LSQKGFHLSLIKKGSWKDLLGREKVRLGDPILKNGARKDIRKLVRKGKGGSYDRRGTPFLGQLEKPVTKTSPL